MESVDKYVNEDTTERFIQKIFRRHDSDKDGYLNKEGMNIWDVVIRVHIFDA